MRDRSKNQKEKKKKRKRQSEDTSAVPVNLNQEIGDPSEKSKEKKKKRKRQSEGRSADPVTLNQEMGDPSEKPKEKKKKRKRQSEGTSADPVTLNQEMGDPSEKPKEKKKKRKRQSEGTSVDPVTLNQGVVDSSRTPKEKGKKSKELPEGTHTDPETFDQRRTAKDAQTDAAEVALQQLAGVPVAPLPSEGGLCCDSSMEVVTACSDQEILKRTVHITEMWEETSPSDLVSFFKDAGRVVDCKMIYDPVTGIKTGDGFILFDSEESAQKALHLNSKLLLQRRVRIRPSSVPFASLRKVNKVSSRGICVAFIPKTKRYLVETYIRGILGRYGTITGVTVENVKNHSLVRALVQFQDDASALRVHQDQPLKDKGYIIHLM